MFGSQPLLFIHHQLSLDASHHWVMARMSSKYYSIQSWSMSLSPAKPYQDDLSKMKTQDFLGDSVVKNLPADAGDTGVIPGPWRSHMPQNN